MSSLFDNLTQKLQRFTDQFAKNAKRYFQSVIFQGEKILKHTAGIERMGTFELGSAEPEYHAENLKEKLNSN